MPTVDSRFHAVSKHHEQAAFLFARIHQSGLELLDSDTAYQASISTPGARVAGSPLPPTTSLLYLVLSIPNTKAIISPGELQLRCTDKSTVQLRITLPLKQIPAKHLLHTFHSGLILTAASLEAALLEIVGVDTRQEIANATSQSLHALHGPLIAGGQPVQLGAAFRRVAGADSRIHAARAFAVASVAQEVREQILGKRRERQDRERLKRQREKERVREAKRLMTAGRSAKRTKTNLFEIENDTPSKEQAQAHQKRDSHIPRTAGAVQTEADRDPSETVKRRLAPSRTDEPTKPSNAQDARQAAKEDIVETSKRKKRRKTTRQLV